MPAGDFQPFPTTHWSLVARAGDDAGESQRHALGELMRRYLGPFRTYVVTKFRVDGHRADDLVAGFVASRLVERNLVGDAEQGRGKFRNFLMTALERYVVDHFRQESAQKRGGNRAPQDVADAQDWLADAGAADPAAAFDASWAREVVRQAVERMRVATESTRPDLWAVFTDRVLGPSFDGSEPSAYADLIARLGYKDEGQAANALHTAKRIFARTLRGIVAEYALSADDVDREIAELTELLGRGG